VRSAYAPSRALQYIVWVSTARWGWYQRVLPDIVTTASLSFLAAQATVAEASTRRTDAQKTDTRNGALSSREAKGTIEEKLKGEPWSGE
jgi:hypothetical protein